MEIASVDDAGGRAFSEMESLRRCSLHSGGEAVNKHTNNTISDSGNCQEEDEENL